MSAPINLNQVRKARAKAAKAVRGDQNAVKFGRSKAERDRDEARVKQALRQVDAHKRDP